MNRQNDAILQLVSYFAIDGDPVHAWRFGSGHINDTYRITTDNPNGNAYLLQRINSFIFPDIPKLMENLDRICQHLKAKLSHLDQKEIERQTVTIIPCWSGELYFQDGEGAYWRMFLLIPDTHSYDVLETAEQAYAGGVAFGHFQQQLADFDASRLHHVLPRFHDFDFRMGNLHAAIARDPQGRGKTEPVQLLLSAIAEREQEIRSMLSERLISAVPLRIIHNDTKFNNVLLNNDDEVQCVIDLDTVMPGYVAYDFGDAIRTIINNGAEDDPNLSNITLNLPFFQAYANGYIREAQSFLTDSEVDSLLFGVRLMPYMQSIRFLTDYIAGDVYYKTGYATHNLVRTQAQMKLLWELEQHQDTLESLLRQSLNA